MNASKLVVAAALSGAVIGCSSDDSQIPQDPTAPPLSSSYVDIKRENYQQVIDGKAVDLYTLSNATGMFVRITNYGAKIEQLVAPDKSGVFGDVVLGYDTIDDVVGGQASAGAFMGRYANRIAGGKLVLDGMTYQLPLNDGTRPNTLHGGVKGARQRVFEAFQLSPSALELRYDFADGEEGFPGTLSLIVLYSLTDDNELHVDYSGTAVDKKTVFNFTCHPFFNLSNDPTSLILSHQVAVNADRVLEINQNLIPTGTLRSVAATPMDFRTSKPIGQDIAASYDLLMLAGGYDHTYVLNKSADDRLSFAASVYEPSSGRTLEVWSTEPSMQLYSGNGFAGQAPRDTGKGGVLYALHAGLALEPMHYPDSPNQPSFPSTVLDAGETYQGTILYKFGTK